MLQCQYAFVYQSLSDYLRLRSCCSCCCWSRDQLNEEEDSVIIGSPIYSTTTITCWSDVILNRSPAIAESRQLPSSAATAVHQMSRPQIWTSRPRRLLLSNSSICSSSSSRSEMRPSIVVVPTPQDDECLDRQTVMTKKQVKRGRRLKNKVRPATDRGECGAESVAKGMDTHDQSDELQCKSHSRVMIRGECEERTAVGVCTADKPDSVLVPVTIRAPRDKAEEQCIEMKLLRPPPPSLSDCRTDHIVPCRLIETRNKESDTSNSCPAQLSEHVLHCISYIYSLI